MFEGLMVAVFLVAVPFGSAAFRWDKESRTFQVKEKRAIKESLTRLALLVPALILLESALMLEEKGFAAVLGLALLIGIAAQFSLGEDKRRDEPRDPFVGPRLF